MTAPSSPGLDAETRDGIRDLCEAVAQLAAGTVHMIGTATAGDVMAKARRLCERMDTLDQEGDEAVAGTPDPCPKCGYEGNHVSRTGATVFCDGPVATGRCGWHYPARLAEDTKP